MREQASKVMVVAGGGYGAQPEEHEVFEASWVPLEEAVDLAARGQLRDAKSLIGLLCAVFVANEAAEAARMGGGKSFGSSPSYQRSAPALS